MEKSNRVLVTVTKSFSESAESVFDAWLDTRSLTHWMFGPAVRDEQIVSLTNDPKPEGRFSFKVKRDGITLDHLGTYLEITRPTRLVFTWGVDDEPGDESIVSIDIVPAMDGCTLTLNHDMDIKWTEYAKRTEESWTRMLELLKNGLKELKPA